MTPAASPRGTGAGESPRRVRSPRASASIILALAVLPSATPAEPPALRMPIDCVLGETCHVQNYLDRDPGPGFADFTCGSLGYDGHGGTDFALPDLAAMEAGVDVLAAAPGVVMGTRDGMPDVSFRDAGAPEVAERECGNGVALDHGQGWSTQYCHLARGSVAVRPGDRVEAGDVLGRVGLSGQSEFPHLHLSVRQGEERVDPFDASGEGCGDGALDPLWAEPIPYVPTGLVGLGLLDRVPEWGEVTAGGLGEHPGVPGAPLVLWAQAFGSRPGDLLRLRIEGPDGAVIDEPVELDRTQAAYFRAQGRRAPAGGWPAGRYVGRAELSRDGETIDMGEVRLRIE